MKFSVTIPAYKAKFIKEAIESVLSQSYENFELIIVDDNSPENLKAIVDGFSDSRIRYYRNPQNCGALNVVDNWNICLSYCTGEYVICMGDDDRLLPNCLYEYFKLIKKYPGIGLIHGWTEIINESSEITNLTCRRCTYETAMSLLWHRTFLFSHQFIGDFCFNKECLLNIKGFYYLPMAWGSDDITAVLCAGYNGIVNTQIPVFQYRVNSQTISKSGDGMIKMEAIRLRRDWMDSYLSKECNDPLDELYRKELITYQQSYFERIIIDTIAIDIRNHSFARFISWIHKRTKLNLDFRVLIKALIISLKK